MKQNKTIDGQAKKIFKKKKNVRSMDDDFEVIIKYQNGSLHRKEHKILQFQRPQPMKTFYFLKERNHLDPLAAVWREYAGGLDSDDPD